MSAGNEIGDLLLDIGLITDEELASAHAEQTKTGERLTLVLERLGLITHHQLKDALELQFGVNFYSLSKSPPAKEIADLLSYETKNKYRVIPVTWAGTQFTIAMVNPDDLIALDAVRVELKSGHLKKVVCTADEFEFFMRDLYETPAEEAPTPATAAPVAAPSAAEAAKPAAKVAAKGHLKSLFGDDDDDEDDVPVIPLPTVSPAAAALSAKLAPSLQDKDDDFDDDDDTDIPMPTVKPVRKFSPLGEAPDAVLQATPAAPAALSAPVVPAALDDEAPILNINTPTVNVVSQVSAALKQDQPVNNGNGAVAEEAPAVAASTAALPPAFGLEAAKAFGLDDDDEDDDSDIPLPTVQPRKPAAAATPAPTPTPIPVVAPIVSPAAAPVVSAPVLSTQPAVTPRKPAASVTAHTLPALNPDLLLSPMVSPAVAQKLLEEPKAEDIINSLVDSNADLHTAEPVKVTPFFQSDATAQSLASADYNIEDVVANVANNLVESIDTNVGYAPNASRQLLEEVVESELGGLEDNDINKLKEQQNSSIMLLAHEIIGKATQKRCSDIHLEPDASGVTLRYFLHGELLADCVLPGEIHQALVSSYKIIAGLNPNELRKPQDKKIVTDVEADRVELRITTLPSDHGEMVAISMRFLEK